MSFEFNDFPEYRYSFIPPQTFPNVQRIAIIESMKHRLFTLIALATLGRAGTLYNFSSFDGPGNNAGGTTVNGINNNGQVVGFTSNNGATPTLLTNFIRNADGTFTHLNINNDPLGMANGINNVDTVVGGSNNLAFTLSNGIFSTIPSVTNAVQSEVAFGINDSGLVVGQFTDSHTATTPGFLDVGGTFTILNPVINAAVTNAQGVNNLGLVTGFYSTDGAHQHGFFYSSSTHQFILAADPVIPNLFLTQFLGINDLGLVVGYYQTNDGSQHGFLYNKQTQTYTFLDDPNAAVSGVSVTQITGINNSDEITGFYVDAATGIQRGFIATATPEPATYGAVLGGLLLMIGARRWRS